MSEVEKKEENKEDSEKISEDLEKIIKTVEEEVVLPEDETELEEVESIEEPVVREAKEAIDVESIYSMMNSINILKAEVRKIYEKVDNLENTIKYLIDSVNEIKSVILLVSHSRGREKERPPAEHDLISNINKMIELAEDAILSAVKPEVIRAIKIEALRLKLRGLLEKAKKRELVVPRELLNRMEETLRNLDKEASVLRKSIMGS